MKMKRIEVLQRTALFGCLTEEELADVAQRAVELHFRKGEVLFLSGEQARGLFVVLSGKIRVFQHSAAGREVVTHVDTAGAVIGEIPVFDDGPYVASAGSESDVDALFIDKGDMYQLCVKYPPLALRALRLMAERVRGHAQLVEALSFHEVGERLALFLLAEVQRADISTQGRITFLLPLSNQEIAGRIGSVRDVVARAFARLKHDGLIATQGRTVIIPDIDALKLYAANAESDATMRARQHKP